MRFVSVVVAGGAAKVVVSDRYACNHSKAHELAHLSFIVHRRQTANMYRRAIQVVLSSHPANMS